jgi:2'-5' RNA ligase
METIRAFIAIGLPVEVKQALGQLNEELAARVPRGGVRWVKPAQMHLTLYFLGDTPLARLPDIQRVLDDVTGRYAPFTLYLGRTGCFPNCRRPRVIWVGLEMERLEIGRLETREEPFRGDSTLVRLKQELDNALRPLGWEPDKRPFRAHLTIGRVKDNSQVHGISWVERVERVETAAAPPLAIPVTAVYLIQSDLRPDGPIYTIRHTAFLTG